MNSLELRMLIDRLIDDIFKLRPNREQLVLVPYDYLYPNMKISDLVKWLHTLKRSHGDVEVRVIDRGAERPVATRDLVFKAMSIRTTPWIGDHPEEKLVTDHRIIIDPTRHE